MADDLVTVLARAFKKHRIDSEIRALQDEVDGREPYNGFTDEEFAQAALAAIAEAGYAVVPREVIVQARNAITELCDKRNLMTDENAELLNSLAAALAGDKP